MGGFLACGLNRRLQHVWKGFGVSVGVSWTGVNGTAECGWVLV